MASPRSCSPLEIAARWLPPVRAASFLQMARLLLAAWGIFLLARFLGVGEGAAVLAAFTFTGSAFLQIWRLHTLTYVIALTPWILFALLRFIRQPTGSGAGLLALTGALGVYAGHPETLFQSVLFGLLISIPWLFEKRPELRSFQYWKSLFRWSEVAVLLSVLLAAPALFPFLETLTVSAEWEHRQSSRHQKAEMSLETAVLRTWPALDLMALGNPLEGTWAGPDNLAEIGGASVALTALALIPAALTRRRLRRQALIWLSVGLLGLLVSAHYPVISWPFGELPLIRDTLLKRLTFWWVLAASLLAAFGAENLRHLRGRRAALGGVLALAVLLELLDRQQLAPRDPDTQLMLLLQLGTLVATLFLASRRWIMPLLLLLVLLPRVLLFQPWVPVSSAYSFYPATPSVTWVQERAAGFRVAGIGPALLPASAAFFGLEDVRGNDPMTFGMYAEFESFFAQPQRGKWAALRSSSHPALDFLGVRYIFDHPTMYIFDHGGLEAGYESEDALVFENPRAFERLFRPHEVQVFSRPAAALEAARSVEDFSRLVTASGPGLPPPGSYPNGEAKIEDLQVEPGYISAVVTAQTLSLMATSQPAIPGWRLWMDGEEISPSRVNGAFLSVPVPPGRHLVEFRYAPLSWRLGCGLFLFGVAGWSGLQWRSRREQGISEVAKDNRPRSAQDQDLVPPALSGESNELHEKGAGENG
ncbi:MAG: YfhO family protein [Deltaproteobacteria bacterium]|nr:YfhO family protein [Deltaproteobacteria bacterium]